MMNQTLKKEYQLTAWIPCPVEPGFRVLMLTRDNSIRTSPVAAVLRQNAESICFETQNSIYTVQYAKAPGMMEH